MSDNDLTYIFHEECIQMGLEDGLKALRAVWDQAEVIDEEEAGSY